MYPEIASSSSTDVKPTVQTPAVVVTSKGVTLADKLKLSELPLATTPAGKVFALKALHPSEHTIKTARVPGGVENSTALACDMVQTIPITGAGAHVQVALSPNPVVPAMVSIIDGGVTSYANFYNVAFGGAYEPAPSIAETARIIDQFALNVAKYRITSQSVTVELIAPALADQGTVTAAQYVLPPRTCQISDLTSQTVMAMQPDAWAYPKPVDPSTVLLGTSAYTAKAREGCYMPLKLTDFSYYDTSDRAWMMEMNDAQSIYVSGFSQNCSTPIVFPYFENRSAATGWGDVPRMTKPCGSLFGVISMDGMAANVSIRIRLRQVVEIVARQGTLYTPVVEVPPPPDSLAIKMYQEVASRMMDAYPASYNDLGTLLKKVSEMAKDLLPYVEPALALLEGLPGAGGIVAKGAHEALGLTKKLVGTYADTKKKVKEQRASKKKSAQAASKAPAASAKN